MRVILALMFLVSCLSVGCSSVEPRSPSRWIGGWTGETCAVGDVVARDGWWRCGTPTDGVPGEDPSWTPYAMQVGDVWVGRHALDGSDGVGADGVAALIDLPCLEGADWIVGYNLSFTGATSRAPLVALDVPITLHREASGAPMGRGGEVGGWTSLDNGVDRASFAVDWHTDVCAVRVDVVTNTPQRWVAFAEVLSLAR